MNKMNYSSSKLLFLIVLIKIFINRNETHNYEINCRHNQHLYEQPCYKYMERFEPCTKALYKCID